MTDFATLADYEFGAGSAGTALLGRGWSAPEAAFTWSAAKACEVNLPAPPGEAAVFLRVLVRPFVALPRVAAQRVRAWVNGAAQDVAVLEGDTWLGFRAAGGPVNVRLDLPDACVPAEISAGGDTRRLGVALLRLVLMRDAPPAPVPPRRLPPLPVREFDFGEAAGAALRGVAALSAPELLGCFESLGHNCEFGLLQRRCGAEPLGLLRFASITQAALVDGLGCGFEGVDDPALLQIRVEGEERPEFMASHARFGLNGHTFRYLGETDMATVQAEVARKLSFERQRFLDVARSGEKLFVFHNHGEISRAEAHAIHHALRHHGTAGLLVVTLGSARDSGSVVSSEVGLYRGAVRSFAPLSAADRIDLTAWISVCANAYRLWREQGFGG